MVNNNVLSSLPTHDFADMVAALYRAGDSVRFRVFSDKKGDTFTGAKIASEAGKIADVEPLLRRHNEAGRCISVVVNTGGDTDAEITRINAQWVENDDLPKDEQMKALQAFSLPPSIIVESEKSLHAYWLVKADSKVELFRSIQKALADHFHGDQQMANPSRAMRLPGFWHQKKDTPFPVRIIEYHPERRYTQDELIAVLPEYVAPAGGAASPAEHEVKEGSEQGLACVLAGCAFLEYCRLSAAGLSEHDWYAMITNLAPFEGGREAIHQLSAPYPGYTAEATDKKIDHFLESKTGPITCKTIAEKGWQCPHMKDGSCKCKAPAAKAYEPLPTDVLEKIIDAMPVSADQLKNLAAIDVFIKAYLYNVSPSVAAALLNYRMKTKYHLTTADLRPMLSLQKSLNKDFGSKRSASAKKASAGALPPWYSVNEDGKLKFMPGVLADYLVKNSKVMYAAQQFYMYADGVYGRITDLTAKNIVREHMLVNEAKTNQIIDAVSQWKMMTEADVRELNPNPYLINVKNGMYDVLKGQLVPHDERYHSTMQLNVTFDQQAQCPRFMQFLQETLEADQIPLIQEMLGYCLIPVARAQKCFVLVGEASAGKSVLLRVISDILLGDENVSHVSWQALNERFKPAELFGRLANVFADLPTKNIDDNGIFKALVGEDKLTVERKNKDPFSFMSTARLIFSCNSIPRNYGDRSEGFYRRLIIIRYTHAVPKDKRDPGLVDKLKSEADGFFQFALEGLRRLIANDYEFSVTESNVLELQKYREDSNSVLAFVKECCELDPDAMTATVDFYTKYKDYCEACGVTPFAQRRVGDELGVAFPAVQKGRDKVGSRRIWKGIKVVDTGV